VCLSVYPSPHSHTTARTRMELGRGCTLVVHYWADLQSGHGLRCYGDIARTRNVSECLYSLYAWLLVLLLMQQRTVLITFSFKLIFCAVNHSVIRRMRAGIKRAEINASAHDMSTTYFKASNCFIVGVLDCTVVQCCWVSHEPIHRPSDELSALQRACISTISDGIHSQTFYPFDP